MHGRKSIKTRRLCSVLRVTLMPGAVRHSGYCEVFSLCNFPQRIKIKRGFITMVTGSEISSFVSAVRGKVSLICAVVQKFRLL